MLLLFDQRTRLLAKTEFKIRLYDKNDRLSDREIFLERYYGDYEKTGGVFHWRKNEQYQDGRKHCEINVTDVRLFEKVDEEVFSPPGTPLAEERRLREEKEVQERRRRAEEERRRADEEAEKKRRLAEEERRRAEEAALAKKAEKESASEMEKAKKRESQGRLEEALELCQGVLKSYSQTKAAGDAREMSKRIGPVVAEKKAAAMLEIAKKLEAKHHLVEAHRTCKELLETYSGTKAAAQARSLRDKITRVIDAEKKEERAAVKMRFAKSLLQERRTESALRLLHKLVKAFPDTPTAKEAEKLIKQYEE
jgi:hypothetical protein